MSEPKPLLAPSKPLQREARVWTTEGFIADPWRHSAGDESMPASSHVIVPLADWRTGRARTGDVQIGIEVQPADSLDGDLGRIERLPLIVLVFPRFTDGRAYSMARQLREQWGYRGELRARGDVLLDQLPLMLGCGFDSFEICDAATLGALDRGFVPAADHHLRHAAGRMRRWHCHDMPKISVAAE